MSPILTRMSGSGSAGSGFGFGRSRGNIIEYGNDIIVTPYGSSATTYTLSTGTPTNFTSQGLYALTANKKIKIKVRLWRGGGYYGGGGAAGYYATGGGGSGYIDSTVISGIFQTGRDGTVNQYYMAYSANSPSATTGFGGLANGSSGYDGAVQILSMI